jgi:hypothetical protein
VAIDHQADLIDRTEAAIRWVQARAVQLKRIVATHPTSGTSKAGGSPKVALGVL